MDEGREVEAHAHAHRSKQNLDLAQRVAAQPAAEAGD